MKNYLFLCVAAALFFTSVQAAEFRDPSSKVAPIDIDYGEIRRRVKVAVVKSLGNRVLYRLKQPFLYVKKKLTGTTPSAGTTPPAGITTPSVWEPPVAGERNLPLSVAEKKALETTENALDFSVRKRDDMRNRNLVLSPEMEAKHTQMTAGVAFLRANIRILQEKLVTFNTLLKTNPCTEATIKEILKMYESLSRDAHDFGRKKMKFDFLVSSFGETTDLTFGSLLSLSGRYNSLFRDFDSSLFSYERLIVDLTRKERDFQRYEKTNYTFSSSDVADLNRFKVWKSSMPGLEEYVHTKAEKILEKVPFYVLPEQDPVAQRPFAASPVVGKEMLQEVVVAVEKYKQSVDQKFTDFTQALQEVNLQELGSSYNELKLLLGTKEALERQIDAVYLEDQSLKNQRLTLALDLEDSYQAYSKKLREYKSYNIVDLQVLLPVFTLARQALEQDKEVAGQEKSDAFIRFFEGDSLHPLKEDSYYSNQPQDEFKIPVYRLHVPVEKLAEILLWDSGSQELQEAVRTTAESFLRSADPKSYPQVQKILELYNSFNLLKSQVFDIVTNANESNGEDDKGLVVKELKAFLQEIEAIGRPLKNFVFVKKLQEVVTKQLTELKSKSLGFIPVGREIPVELELPPVGVEIGVQENRQGITDPDADQAKLLRNLGVAPSDDDASSTASFVSAEEEQQRDVDVTDVLSEAMQKQVDLAKDSINQLKTLAVQFSVHAHSVDSIGLAEEGLSIIKAFKEAMPASLLEDSALKEELEKITVLFNEALRVQKLAVVASLQRVYETFRSDFGKTIYPPLTDVLKQHILQVLTPQLEEFVVEGSSFSEFTRAVKASLNVSGESKGLSLLLDAEQQSLQSLDLSYVDYEGQTRPVAWLKAQDRVVAEAFEKYPKQGELAAVQALVPEFEQAYLLAVFKSLTDEQKEDLKSHNQSLYFSLTTDVFEQQMKGYLRTIFGAKTFEFKNQERLDQFLANIGKEKASCDAYLESLKESHDDALIQKMKSQLQPWYDELVDVENQLKKTKKGLVVDTTPWWRKAHAWWKNLITGKQKIDQPEESSVDQFLQDPLTYLQDQSFEVRGQLRALKKTVDGKALGEQLRILQEQIQSGALTKEKAKIQFALLEKYFELLRPARAYEDIYNTYTFLSSPGLLAFEKIDPKNPKSKPLTNEAVVRFIATSLGIGILDVFSLSRSELLDKLTIGKTTGEEMDYRYRDLSMVLCNDFVWAIELRKLEGNPVSINYAKMKRQFFNFQNSYPEFSMQGDVAEIDLLIKTMKTVFLALFPLDKSEPVVDNSLSVVSALGPVHALPVVHEEVVVDDNPNPSVVVRVSELVQPVPPVAPEVVVSAQGPVVPVVVGEAHEPELVVSAQGHVVSGEEDHLIGEVYHDAVDHGGKGYDTSTLKLTTKSEPIVIPPPVVKPAPKPIQDVLEPIQKQIVAMQAKMLEITDILKTPVFTSATVAQFEKASDELQALEKSFPILNSALVERIRKRYMRDLKTDLQNSAGTVSDNIFITNYLTMLDQFAKSYEQLTTKMNKLSRLQSMINQNGRLDANDMKKLITYATGIPITASGKLVSEETAGFESYVRSEAKKLLAKLKKAGITGSEQKAGFISSEEPLASGKSAQIHSQLEQVSTKITKVKADLAEQFDSMQLIKSTVLAKKVLDAADLKTLYDKFEAIKKTISQRAGIASELESISIPTHLDLQGLRNQKFLLGIELESLYLQRLQLYREIQGLHLDDLKRVEVVFNEVSGVLDKPLNGIEIDTETVEALKKLLIWESSNEQVQKYVRDTAAEYLVQLDVHDEGVSADEIARVETQFKQLKQAVKDAQGSEQLQAAKLALERFKKQFETTGEKEALWPDRLDVKIGKYFGSYLGLTEAN